MGGPVLRQWAGGSGDEVVSSHRCGQCAAAKLATHAPGQPRWVQSIPCWRNNLAHTRHGMTLAGDSQKSIGANCAKLNVTCLAHRIKAPGPLDPSADRHG